MKITIEKRFAPHIHALHAQCLLPGTSLVVDLAFPHLRLGEIEKTLPQAPGFCNVTLQQDLDKNCVWIFSYHFRMKIFAKTSSVEMILYQKGQKPQIESFSINGSMSLKTCERLSFGVHKAQDWELVLRRFDLREILPILYSLAQKTPSDQKVSEQTIDLELLKMRLRSNLKHILAPSNPHLMHEIFATIRSWMFAEEKNSLSFLSFCPFPAGRLTSIQSHIGSIDLEWRKKVPRRMVISSSVQGEIELKFPKAITSFRWKNAAEEKGQRHFINKPFCLEPDTTYLLDCFYTTDRKRNDAPMITLVD